MRQGASFLYLYYTTKQREKQDLDCVLHGVTMGYRR